MLLFFGYFMWWELLFRFKKQILIVIACAGLYGAGWWSGVETTEPVIVTKTKIEEKIVEKERIIIKEIFIEVTKKDTKKTTTITESKDGSKTTVIKEETKEESDKKSNKDSDADKIASTDKTTQNTPKVVSTLPKYRIGMVTEIQSISDFSELNYGFSSGVRLFGPLWLGGTYLIKSKTATLEFSYEF